MKFGKTEHIIIVMFFSAVVVTVLWLGIRARTLKVVQPQSGDSLPAASARRTPQGSPTPAVAEAVTRPVAEAERRKMLETIETTPIVFFGQVVDQHHIPVAGARVMYTVHHLNFYGNSPVEGPVTDNNGRFEIRTEGPSLTVSVTHPEFYPGKHAERQVDYSNSAAQRDAAKPTRESPTLFELVKKGHTETIIHVRSKEIRLPLDGRPVEINLGEKPLKLNVRLHSASRPSEPNEFRRFEWRVVLAVPDGGLIERLSSLDFQAPETGYVPEVEVPMPLDDTVAWSSRINKDYFVRAPTGTYGRFQISVSGESGFCRFESYFNPSGSRNLEVDPTKVVSPSVSGDN
jgi:hypothetical protein